MRLRPGPCWQSRASRFRSALNTSRTLQGGEKALFIREGRELASARVAVIVPCKRDGEGGLPTVFDVWFLIQIVESWLAVRI